MTGGDTHHYTTEDVYERHSLYFYHQLAFTWLFCNNQTRNLSLNNSYKQLTHLCKHFLPSPMQLVVHVTFVLWCKVNCQLRLTAIWSLFHLFSPGFCLRFVLNRTIASAIFSLYIFCIHRLLTSRVAQRKRAGPITQRSVDRNHPLLHTTHVLSPK